MSSHLTHENFDSSKAPDKGFFLKHSRGIVQGLHELRAVLAEPRYKRKSVEDIFLFASLPASERKISRFELKGSITEEHLKQLPDLDIEVGIVVLENGKRIVTLGSENKVNHHIESRHPRITELHSHPKKTYTPIPSASDLLEAEKDYTFLQDPPAYF